MFSNFKFPALVFISTFLLLSAGIAIAQTSTKFAAPRAYDGGIGFATDDFNNDGNLDVVSAKADRLNLLTGNGGGTFLQAAPTTIFSCASFSSTALSVPLSGDFNGDGKKDVAAWIEDNSCSGRGLRAMMILPGNGTGGFGAPMFTDVSNFFFTPTQFVAADFNGDGRTDVAAATAFSTTDGDKVAVFLGGTNGSFAEPVTYNLGGQAFFTLTLGDFNNDNRPDLAFARRSPSDLIVLPNNGNGTFAAPQVFNAGTMFGRMVSGHFNNDNNLDLVVARELTPNPTFQIFLGNGNNAFTAGATFTTSVINATVNNMLSGDFTNDGRHDLVFSVSNRTVVLKSNGNGTFTEDEVYGVGGARLIKGDFNNDNWTDLITNQTLGLNGSASGASQEFAVLPNLQNGKFLAAPALELPFGGGELAIADFNNDGLKDIAMTGDAINGEIALILQDPDVSFELAAPRRIEFESVNRTTTAAAPGGEGISPRTIATGDFNQDGKTDVVVAGRAPSGATENVIVARNDGAGNLTLFSTLSLGGTVTKVLVDDFNGDNILDLAFSQSRDFSPAAVPAVSVALGVGNGTFGAPVGYLTNNVIGNSLTKGNFNGDNRPDLAVALSTATVAVLLNNGNGSFTVGANYNVPANATEIAAADLHGDGKADLIVVNNSSFIANSAKVSVYAGVGDGTFSAAPVNYPTVWFYDQRMAVDDYNGDNKPDVALTHNGVVSVLENDGNGALNRKTLWATTGALREIASGDIDGDQKPDLITTSGVQAFLSMSLMPNVTAPAANRRARFDYDSDGKADVGVFRPADGVWYLNRSSQGFTGVQFGISSDKLAPADYDGDGKFDFGVFRDGVWYLLRSTQGFTAVQFGSAGDVPQPADFDGDGKAELAVFRPSVGSWFTLNLVNGQFNGIQFGISTDKPVVGDYDGDGKADYAVYRPSDGTWYLLRSQSGFTGIQFGIAADKPVPADYDGDGKTDPAVYRNGVWYQFRSNGGFIGVQFGISTDLPAPADFDGDGKTDPAVFRNGVWYILQSASGFTGYQFGSQNDKPVSGAFVY